MINNSQISQLLLKILFGVKRRMKSFKVAKQLQIPEVHGKVMLTLLRLGQLGPTELANYLLKDKAQLARVIGTLEEEKFVRKLYCEEDKRSYFLELTQKGKHKAKKISKYHEKAVSCLMDGFSDEEKEMANNLLNRMLQNLDKHQEVFK